MKSNIKLKLEVVLAALAMLVPGIVLGQCIYGWDQTVCLMNLGNSAGGSCPGCSPSHWTTGGPYYNYPCTSYNPELMVCSEFTYSAQLTQYEYQSGTKNCPTTCGTVWSPAAIGTDCTGQDYVYCY